MICICVVCCFFFQAEDGIRDLVRSRGLGDVYKRQDFVQGKIWSTQRNATGWANKRLELDSSEQISSFGEDEAGELYVLSLIHI